MRRAKCCAMVCQHRVSGLIADTLATVATGRQKANFSCKQLANLLQLRPPNRRLSSLTSHLFACCAKLGLAQPPIRGLIVMKSALIKVAAVAAFTVLAGCQDLKPLQADVDNLKQQVSRLTADLAATKSCGRCRECRRAVGFVHRQRCADRCQPGAGCRAGFAVLLRCDQREDRPDVPSLDLEVRAVSSALMKTPRICAAFFLTRRYA